MVSVGVEVIVDGNIYIYVLFCGCVLVGVQGDQKVCIFIISFEVELVFIGGVYCMFELL